MTIAQLIMLLNNYNQNTIVYIYSGYGSSLDVEPATIVEMNEEENGVIIG